MSTRTNLVYLPCCYGDFDCHDQGKGCIHKRDCKSKAAKAAATIRME
jgi:hypothetical protein